MTPLQQFRHARRMGWIGPPAREVQMPQVIIRRGKDGIELGIDSADFKRGKHFEQADGTRVTYEEAGFEIVGHQDGRPYEPPKPPAERTPS